MARSSTCTSFARCDRFIHAPAIRDFLAPFIAIERGSGATRRRPGRAGAGSGCYGSAFLPSKSDGSLRRRAVGRCGRNSIPHRIHSSCLGSARVTSSSPCSLPIRLLVRGQDRDDRRCAPAGSDRRCAVTHRLGSPIEQRNEIVRPARLRQLSNHAEGCHRVRRVAILEGCRPRNIVPTDLGTSNALSRSTHREHSASPIPRRGDHAFRGASRARPHPLQGHRGG